MELINMNFCFITSISLFLSSLSSATCLQHTCTDPDLTCGVYSDLKGRAVLFGGHCRQQTSLGKDNIPFTLGCAAGYCIACR